MKLINILISVSISLLTISCIYGQQVKRDNSVEINLNHSNNLFEEFPDYSSLAFNETPSGNVPGFITKLLVRNDTLFILDGYKSKSFYAYLSDGQPLFEYNKLGNAPDEYLFLGDMDIDDKYIYLLDNDSHKILVLGKDGKFLKKEDIPSHVSHIKAIDELDSKKTYILDMYNSEKARLLSHHNKKSDTLMFTPDGMANFNYIPQNVFQSDLSDRRILYMPSYSSVIYYIDANRHPQELMNIDFNGLMPDSLFFQSLSGKKTQDKFKLVNDGFAHSYSFNSNSTSILIGFIYGNKAYFNFIDKNSKKVKTYDMPSIYSAVALTDSVLYLRSKDSDELILINIFSHN